MMDVLIKAAAVCIVVSLMALLLRRNTPELALLLSLAAVVAVMGWAISMASDVERLWQMLLGRTSLDGGLFAPLGKIIVISMISRLGSDLCLDAGQKALATVVEMVGAFGALAAALPLAERAMSLLMGLG